MKANDQPSRLAGEIAKEAGLAADEIWIDMPDPVNLQGTGREGLVKFDETTAVPIQEMFPIGGWLSAYQSYRAISYIFAFRERQKVGRAALKILASNEYKVILNNVAVKYARADDSPQPG
jgi:hypothetical protein